MIRINITTYLWNDNEHNLFDYESEQIIKREMQIDFQGINKIINFLATIVQVKKEVVALTKSVYIIKYVRNSFRIKEKFFILSANKNKSKLQPQKIGMIVPFGR